MGLDMYLRKKTYIGNQYRDPDKQIKLLIPEDQTGVTFPIKKGRIKEETITEITSELAYWRKANAIHSWFVKHVQGGEDDCKEYTVTNKQLKKLQETIKKVLANPEKLGPKLLPTQEGFFFGQTEYDKWYIEDLEYTEKILDKLLAEDCLDEITYYSSW